MKFLRSLVVSFVAIASVEAVPRIPSPVGGSVSSVSTPAGAKHTSTKAARITSSKSARVTSTKSASASASSKAPSGGEVDKGISQALFDEFTHYSQWAAAAYCSSNFQNGAKATLLTCASQFCPAVEQAKAVSVFEWQKPTTDNALQIFDDVPGYIATDPVRKEIVVAFRGTIPVPDNILTDADFFLTPAAEFCSNCQVHNGFYNAWLAYRDVVIQHLSNATAANKGYKVVVVGHSLGGAVATIAAADLRNSKLNCDLYTYGSPRVGDKNFANLVSSSNMGSVYRVTHLDDPIPHVPFSLANFYHTMPEYWISDGTRDQTVYKPADIDKCLPAPDGTENLSCANSEALSLGLDALESGAAGLLNWISGGTLHLPLNIVNALDSHHHYFQNIDNCSPGAGYQ